MNAGPYIPPSLAQTRTNDRAGHRSRGSEQNPNTYSARDKGKLVWFDAASQHRVKIWAFPASRIAGRPLVGWGFDASDDLPSAGMTKSQVDLDKLMPGHPHNAVLQIWRELGVVGAAIALAQLLAALRLVKDLPRIEQPAAQAAFVSSFATALVGYGIWQHQWVGTLFAAAIVVSLLRGPTEANAVTPASPAH